MPLLAAAGLLALAVAPGAWAFFRDASMLTEPRALGAMLYYGVGPTVLGFWLWYTGASQRPGAEAAAFTAVAPVTAMALSVLIMGEAMAWRHVAGMALVLAAIIIAASSEGKS